MRNTAITSRHHNMSGSKFPVAALLMVCAVVNACSSLPPGHDYPRIESRALAQSVHTTLSGRLEKAISEHGGNSGFRLLSFGADGYLTRMQIINATERTLDLQYFIFRGDETVAGEGEFTPA